MDTPVNTDTPAVDELKDKKLGGAGQDDDLVQEPVENKPAGSGGGTGTGTDINAGSGTQPVEIWVDEMPEFPGGEEAMLQYMADHVRYTEYEIDRNVSGMMYMSFVVNSDGTISGIRTDRKIKNGDRLEDKAMKAIEKMPRWKPGKKHGKMVAFRFTMPLKFQIRQ